MKQMAELAWAFVEKRPVVRYALSGGTATVVNFGVFLALHSIQPAYRASVFVGYISGTGVAYVISRIWVFRSVGPVPRESVKFVLLDLVALFFQLVFLDCLIFLGLEIPIGNGIAILIVASLKYFAAKHLVFRSNL